MTSKQKIILETLEQVRKKADEIIIENAKAMDREPCLESICQAEIRALGLLKLCLAEIAINSKIQIDLSEWDNVKV